MTKLADTSADKAYLVALAVPAGLILAVYVAQYGFGLAPCEMCWWQRWPHFAAVALAGLSFVLPFKRPLVALAAVAVLISGLIGVFQRNEYLRHGRTVARRRGMVDVLTGTSTLFRPMALRTVAQSRGHALPGRRDGAGDGLLLERIRLDERRQALAAIHGAGIGKASAESGVMATRFSPSNISFGAPIFTLSPPTEYGPKLSTGPVFA